MTATASVATGGFDRLPLGEAAGLLRYARRRLAVPLNTYKSWPHRGRLCRSGKSVAGKMSAAFAVAELIRSPVGPGAK